MTYNKLIHTALLLIVTMFVFSCKKDDETTVEENITKVVVELTKNGVTTSYAWEDKDGDGGNTPVIDSIKLTPNTLHSGRIRVFDGSNEITSEIEAESAAHLFTFTSDNLNSDVYGLNTDASGNPFGTTFNWATLYNGSSTMTIRLYHEPTDKNNENSPGGEVDFEVVFPVNVQ